MNKYTGSKVLTKDGIDAVFLFIAELNSFKEGSVQAKLNYGKQCWYESKLNNLDYNSESDRSEANENIWLERLYDGLDTHFQLKTQLVKKIAAKGNVDAVVKLESTPSDTFEWTVPIELDASASMLQYIGILLNDHRLTDMTNITGESLSDPWKFDGIPRTQFKKAATPMLYGSSRACHELWQDGGFEYTMDQVKLFNEELSSGALGIADQFKEFIINYCKPREEMQVKVFNEQFTIKCNRFRQVGDVTIKYDLYDSETKRVRTLHHTSTKKVADLEQFRRYFVTLLIHNLDSQVANEVIGKVIDTYGWGIDIHDAFVVHPNAAADVRLWYSQALDNIYANRTTILSDYFQSIGIGPEAQAAWNRLIDSVHKLQSFKCQPMALK